MRNNQTRIVYDCSDLVQWETIEQKLHTIKRGSEKFRRAKISRFDIKKALCLFRINI